MTKTPFITADKLEQITAEFPTPFHLYDEKGIREIPLDSLMLLAKTYDCSLDYLAGVSDRPRKYGR